MRPGIQEGMDNSMCQDCWKEYGSPEIVNQKTTEAQPLIESVYDYHGAAGGLHVLLDDWNLEFVDERFHSPDDSPQQVQAEEECLRAFQAMTIEERASALAIYKRFVKV